VFDPTLSGFGVYKIVYAVTNEYKCTRLTTRYVNIAQTPRVVLGSDLYMTRGDTVKILGSASTDALLTWNPTTGLSNASIINPTASPQNTTKYVLKAIYKNGCAAEGDVLVTVFPSLKIPSGITPNGDGINDTLEIEGIAELPECDVEIYSRWGEKVFSSKGYSTPFDGTYNGTPLPMATYYYVIKPNNGSSHFKGTVAILK
jgi:gliding motility-associated-like protein